MVRRRTPGGEDEQPSHRGRPQRGDPDLQRERCVTSRAVSYNSSEDKELEMTLNNIDTQFAVARSEIRALMKHVNPNTTVGGQACDALQGMIDALDSIQNDSFRHGISSFHRFPVLDKKV